MVGDVGVWSVVLSGLSGVWGCDCGARLRLGIGEFGCGDDGHGGAMTVLSSAKGELARGSNIVARKSGKMSDLARPVQLQAGTSKGPAYHVDHPRMETNAVIGAHVLKDFAPSPLEIEKQHNIESSRLPLLFSSVRSFENWATLSRGEGRINEPFMSSPSWVLFGQGAEVI